MALDFFTSALGEYQGRIQPSGFEPTDDWAFCLGSDEEDRFVDLREAVVVDGFSFDVPGLDVGDYAEISQSADLTGVNFIRTRARLRMPETMPANRGWEASILIGGTKKSTMVGIPGKTRDRTNMAANVSKLAGAQTVAFRLELVAV